jgi:sodium-coupled neutral amino acid transporter 2
MTIENLENISQKDEQVGDERAPLLSTSQDEEAGYSKFHGSSFHGSVFNWSCTIVGSGIMSLPATLKVSALVPGLP